MKDTAVNEVRTTLRDDLIAGKSLIADPAHWLKGNIADPDDTCFCAYGAICFAPRGRWFSSDDAGLNALTAAIPAGFVSDGSKLKLALYNDHPDTTHADIMALFDRAIASAESSS